MTSKKERMIKDLTQNVSKPGLTPQELERLDELEKLIDNIRSLSNDQLITLSSQCVNWVLIGQIRQELQHLIDLGNQLDAQDVVNYVFIELNKRYQNLTK